MSYYIKKEIVDVFIDVKYPLDRWWFWILPSPCFPCHWRSTIDAYFALTIPRSISKSIFNSPQLTSSDHNQFPITESCIVNRIYLFVIVNIVYYIHSAYRICITESGIGTKSENGKAKTEKEERRRVGGRISYVVDILDSRICTLKR